MDYSNEKLSMRSNSTGTLTAWKMERTLSELANKGTCQFGPDPNSRNQSDFANSALGGMVELGVSPCHWRTAKVEVS